MATAKTRQHNEWIWVLYGPSVCPSCQASNRPKSKNFFPGLIIMAWGEYAAGKWRTIKHCCSQCYKTELVARLVAHVVPCGCKVELCSKSGGGPLPKFLLDEYEAQLNAVLNAPVTKLVITLEGHLTGEQRSEIRHTLAGALFEYIQHRNHEYVERRYAEESQDVKDLAHKRVALRTGLAEQLHTPVLRAEIIETTKAACKVGG